MITHWQYIPRKYTTYILPSQGIICYLPPIQGTRKQPLIKDRSKLSNSVNFVRFFSPKDGPGSSEGVFCSALEFGGYREEIYQNLIFGKRGGKKKRENGRIEKGIRILQLLFFFVGRGIGCN